MATTIVIVLVIAFLIAVAIFGSDDNQLLAIAAIVIGVLGWFEWFIANTLPDLSGSDGDQYGTVAVWLIGFWIIKLFLAVGAGRFANIFVGQTGAMIVAVIVYVILTMLFWWWFWPSVGSPGLNNY